MRIVGGEDDLVAPELVDQVPCRGFVGLHGHPALALEILARRHSELGHKHVTFPFVTLIESPQKPRDPGTIGFEKRDLELRVSFEDAATEEAAEAEYLLEGLGIDTPEPKVWLKMLSSIART